MLAKEQIPALARSATHDVGHAEGSASDGITRNSRLALAKLENRMKDIIGT